MFLPLRLQGLFGLSEALLDRLQLRRHGLVKLTQLNIFVVEPVEDACVLGKLFGFFDDVCIRLNVSRVKKSQIQKLGFSTLLPWYAMRSAS